MNLPLNGIPSREAISRDKLFMKALKQLKTVHDLYKFLYDCITQLTISQFKKALKRIRTRTMRVEQGNIIYLFIRRMLLYFTKLSFKEIVSLTEQLVILILML